MRVLLCVTLAGFLGSAVADIHQCLVDGQMVFTNLPCKTPTTAPPPRHPGASPPISAASSGTEDLFCQGRDGSWYLPGAKECQPIPPLATKVGTVEPKAALAQRAPSEPQKSASEQRHGRAWLWSAVAVLLALVFAALAAGFLGSKKRSKPAVRSVVRPQCTYPSGRPAAPGVEVLSTVPSPTIEVLSTVPALTRAMNLSPPRYIPTNPPATVAQEPPASVQKVKRPLAVAAVDESLELARWKARLVPIWIGTPRTIEFTYESRDGGRHRRKVNVVRISRDAQQDSWYFHGFCHMRKEDRTFNTISITTKILEGNRRWEIEDWITEVAGHEVWDF